MGHRVFKRCPSCGKDHETHLSLPLELVDGRIDESLDLSLNDPYELAESYSFYGLEKLAAEASKLQWCCGKQQFSYNLVSRSPIIWGKPETKIDMAKWLCGEVVRVEEGCLGGSLTGSGAR